MNHSIRLILSCLLREALAAAEYFLEKTAEISFNTNTTRCDGTNTLIVDVRLY